uniref:Peptidase S1 domain-containing protein n=1 Tax=Ditylum brightwellii TaxID=49249 RepID=A0A7S4VAU8_9STRA
MPSHDQQEEHEKVNDDNMEADDCDDENQTTDHHSAPNSNTKHYTSPPIKVDEKNEHCCKTGLFRLQRQRHRIGLKIFLFVSFFFVWLLFLHRTTTIHNNTIQVTLDTRKQQQSHYQHRAAQQEEKPKRKRTRLHVPDNHTHSTSTTTTAANHTLINTKNIAFSKNARIVGGTPVIPGQFPFIASLMNSRGDILCGGSLIAPDIVLTAAHCEGSIFYVELNRHFADDRNEQPENLPPIEQYAFTRSISHPQFAMDLFPEFDYDFALYQLDRKHPNPYKSVIRLNYDPSLPNERNDQVVALGWGKLADDGPPSDELRRVSVQYIENDECGILYSDDGVFDNPITNVMLCASAPNRDACQGDSGGPLIYISMESSSPSSSSIGGNRSMTIILAGVVSWGDKCASEDYPGVYARVSAVTDWIEEIVCDWSPESCDEVNGGILSFEMEATEGPSLNPQTIPSVRPSNAPITTSQSNKPSATPSSTAVMPSLMPTKRPGQDVSLDPSSVTAIQRAVITISDANKETRAGCIIG